MSFQQLKASLELKVVTEVKKWLDPHYRDKNITKDEYKEIVAKCVNKVCFLNFILFSYSGYVICWGALGDSVV